MRLGISTAAGAPGRVLFDLNPDYKNNYAIQANLGIQRQITNNLSIEIAYQMYHGLHIQQPVGLNYCEAGTPGCPATNAAQAGRSRYAQRHGPWSALPRVLDGRGRTNRHAMRQDQRCGNHPVHRLSVARHLDLSRGDASR